jgi:formylglycine-generating enzyme required for sulfatase activity
LEWEYVAAASETKRNAQRDPEFISRILNWYASHNDVIGDTGQRPANVYGIKDLHGLVWEWTNDFNRFL